MADEPVTLDEIMGAIIALQRSMDTRFDKVEAEMAAGFKEASDERKAIRDLVDVKCHNAGLYLS